MKTFPLLQLGFMLLPAFAPAQTIQIVRQVIANGGGFFQNGGLTVLATFGETMTETLRSADYSHILTQGFQQPEPHDTTIIRVIEIYQNRLVVNVFPNPATQFVRITLSEPPQPLTVHLADIQGRLLATQILFAAACEIDVSHLPVGAYLILLSDESAIQGCVKILKTSSH